MGISVRKQLGLTLALSAAVLMWFGNVCTSRSLMGRVLDETGKPIGDAVVAVAWRVHSGHMAQWLIAKETVTSQSGNFNIEGWTMRSPILFGRIDGVYIYAVKKERAPVRANFNPERDGAYHSKTSSLRLVAPPRASLAPDRYEQDVHDLKADLCMLKNASKDARLWVNTPRFVDVVKRIELSIQEPNHPGSACEL